MHRSDTVDLISAPNPLQQQVMLLTRQARSWSERDLPLAVSLLEKAVQAGEPLPSSFTGEGGQDLAEALLYLGQIRLRMRQAEHAEVCFARAQALFSAQACGGKAAVCAGGFGLAQLQRGQPVRAFEYLYPALEQAQASGDPLAAAAVGCDLGCALASLEQAEQALPYLLVSAAALRKLEERLLLSAALDGLGQAYCRQGQRERALECCRESVQLAEAAQAWLRLAGSLRTLGQVYQAQGELDPALACFQRSLNLCQKHGAGALQVESAAALLAVGEIHGRQGRPDLALVSLQDALDTAVQAGDKSLQIAGCKGLVEIFRRQGNYKAALAYLERMQALKETLFDEQAARRIEGLEVSRKLDSARNQVNNLQRENAALQTEIDRHKRQSSRLELLANTDPLTGITNRRRFYDLAAVEMERAKRLRLPLSLIMFDLDHFKIINDTYGHMAGDDVLVEIARRVGGDVRQGDLLARFGGEEFVVLLPETGRALAQITAERLRQRVGSTPIQIAVATLSITISLGVAQFHGQDDLSLEALLDYADRALYQAKESGRNKVMCYTNIS